MESSVSGRAFSSAGNREIESKQGLSYAPFVCFSGEWVLPAATFWSEGTAEADECPLQNSSGVCRICTSPYLRDNTNEYAYLRFSGGRQQQASVLGAKTARGER
jgi:hypothetical protein